jgi:uncharacterized membrane protein
MNPQSPYAPPRAPIDQQPPEDPPTIGYLIGGLIQLCASVVFLVLSALKEPPALSIFGLLLLFLGIRTIIKYRARSRRARERVEADRK